MKTYHVFKTTLSKPGALIHTFYKWCSLRNKIARKLPVFAGLSVKPYSNAELFNRNAIEFREKNKEMPAVHVVGASAMQYRGRLILPRHAREEVQ